MNGVNPHQGTTSELEVVRIVELPDPKDLEGTRLLDSQNNDIKYRRNNSGSSNVSESDMSQRDSESLLGTDTSWLTPLFWKWRLLFFCFICTLVIRCAWYSFRACKRVCNVVDCVYIPRASRIAKNVLLAENNGNHPRFLTLFARKRKILWFHCFKIACLMGILKKKRGFFLPEATNIFIWVSRFIVQQVCC